MNWMLWGLAGFALGALLLVVGFVIAVCLTGAAIDKPWDER